MSKTRNLMLVAAAVLVCVTGDVLAQNGSSSGSYTTRRGGTVTVTRTNNNGQITVNKNATGANGRTASANKTIDADPSDGSLGRTRIVTGPAGRTRTESSSATFGDGDLSVSRRVTGRGGRTASRQATRGSEGLSVTRTGRGGRSFSRSRSR